MEIKPSVNTINDIAAISISDKKTADSSAASGVPSVSSGNAADLKLTSAAQNLLDLQSTVDGISDVDIEKVDSIRQSIANDTYQINTLKLADSLIQSSIELP